MNSDHNISKKKKLGRKREWEVTDKILQEVEALSGRGLTVALIQNYYGISSHTWKNRCNENEELRRSFLRGKAKQIVHVSGKLIEQINAGSTQATIFYLKTQAQWRDESLQEDKEKEIPSVNINVNDPIEAVKVYQQFIRGVNHE